MPGGRAPGGGFEAPDSEYRVDTDVITSVTLSTDTDLTPDKEGWHGIAWVGVRCQGVGRDPLA